MRIQDILRIAVCTFALLLGATAFAALGTGILFNETPVCTEGSALQSFTNCQPGNYRAPILDPRP